MKRALLFLAIMTMSCCFSVSAQNNDERLQRKVSVALRFEQSFYLNDWFDKPYECGYASWKRGFDMMFQMNWDFHRHIGMWIAVGPASFGGNKNFSLDYMPSDFSDRSKYYMSDISENDLDNISGVRYEAGLYYSLNLSKWLLRPSIGVGFFEWGPKGLDYELKEKNSNNYYDVKYSWFSNMGGQSMGYLLLGFDVEYRLSRRISLGTGISYRRIYAHPRFNVRIYDHYDNLFAREPLVEIKHEGNRMNALGINLKLRYHFFKNERMKEVKQKGVMYYPIEQ